MLLQILCLIWRERHVFQLSAGNIKNKLLSIWTPCCHSAVSEQTCTDVATFVPCPCYAAVNIADCALMSAWKPLDFIVLPHLNKFFFNTFLFNNVKCSKRTWSPSGETNLKTLVAKTWIPSCIGDKLVTISSPGRVAFCAYYWVEIRELSRHKWLW